MTGRYRWMEEVVTPDVLTELGTALKVSPLLARCLANRGLKDPDEAARFLEPRLGQLADPFRLPGMEAAVDRLLAARSRSEPVVVFGDYDVDGVTASAMLVEFLGTLGWKVETYLPHRFDEGYGLTTEAVSNCLSEHPARLLIAVDCGSTAQEAIAWLAERGVDTVVLDHHQACAPAPRATALVNPQVGPDASRCGRELCSAGLAFKLAHALVKRGRQVGDPILSNYDVRGLLDLVALGTVADLVPLRDENRILVAAGLRRLASTSRPGVAALMRVGGVDRRVGVYEIGFQLGPRLNAAGRLETATASLELLLSRTPAVAATLASQLDTWNRERQEIERKIATEAVEAVRARFDSERDLVIVEGRSPWHIGVVGIVASRVLREFHRPTIILGGQGEEWRGSGRSIEGFDLARALRECDDLLLRHGGHAMAAGVTIEPNRLDEFRDRLNGVARRVMDPKSLQPPLRLDGEVRIDEIDLARMEELSRLEPAGQGNTPVHFFARGLSVLGEPTRMGPRKQHARVVVTDGISRCEAVWWNTPNEHLPTGRFDLAFRPEVNEYRGQRRLQWVGLDWRSTPPAAGEAAAV